MDFYQTEIEELRQLLVSFDAGNITPEQLGGKLAIYSQIEKRAYIFEPHLDKSILEKRGFFQQYFHNIGFAIHEFPLR